MPKESVRRVRKGTRSCQECRHRKVKCEWAGDDASTCNNCLARSRTCVAQAPVSPVSEVAQLSSRHRIRQLEDQVGSLWNVVHTLQASAQHDTDRVSQDASAEQPYYTSRKTTLDQSRDASSRALEEQPASGEALNDDSRASSDTDDSEPDSFNLLPSNQPNHLRQLFDNDLLDAQGSRDASWQTCDYTGNQSASKTYLTLARRQLQKILPPRDDAAAIRLRARGHRQLRRRPADQDRGQSAPPGEPWSDRRLRRSRGAVALRSRPLSHRPAGRQHRRRAMAGGSASTRPRRGQASRRADRHRCGDAQVFEGDVDREAQADGIPPLGLPDEVAQAPCPTAWPRRRRRP